MRCEAKTDRQQCIFVARNTCPDCGRTFCGGHTKRHGCTVQECGRCDHTRTQHEHPGRWEGMPTNPVLGACRCGAGFEHACQCPAWVEPDACVCGCMRETHDMSTGACMHCSTCDRYSSMREARRAARVGSLGSVA